jgi:hypothetical protein
MLVTLIMPLTPILLGRVFIGEQLEGAEVVGAVIIAAALLIIDGACCASRLDRDRLRRIAAPLPSGRGREAMTYGYPLAPTRASARAIARKSFRPSW